MRTILLMTVLTTACGSKGDDCQRLVDKLRPVMEQMGGKKLSADDAKKFVEECRKDDKMKSDPTMKCVLDANGKAAVNACLAKSLGDYTAKPQKSEATLQLNKLGKNLKVAYTMEAVFPKGKVGPTPAEPCCKGPEAKCPVTQDWSTPPWSDLDFMITEPSRFQYSYESDGKTATATAIGDLDCDGTMITYKLEMSAGADGIPMSNIVEPAPNSD